jgi:hypothetical protein
MYRSALPVNAGTRAGGTARLPASNSRGTANAQRYPPDMIHDAARDVLSPNRSAHTAVTTTPGVIATAFTGRISWWAGLLPRSSRGSAAAGLDRLRAMARRSTAGM